MIPFDKSRVSQRHVLLDDGEPHCSCGYSNRGKHLCRYHDHALEALRDDLREALFLLKTWVSPILMDPEGEENWAKRTEAFIDRRKDFFAAEDPLRLRGPDA